MLDSSSALIIPGLGTGPWGAEASCPPPAVCLIVGRVIVSDPPLDGFSRFFDKFSDIFGILLPYGRFNFAI